MTPSVLRNLAHRNMALCQDHLEKSKMVAALLRAAAIIEQQQATIKALKTANPEDE